MIATATAPDRSVSDDPASTDPPPSAASAASPPSQSPSQQPSSSPSSSSSVLDTPYLYQNRRTSSVSSSTLTGRQLCRVLCPASGTTAATGTAKTTMTNRTIVPETLVIGYDATTGSYSPLGWRAARDVPVLREACARWHYEGEGNVVAGPVTARELAALLRRGGDDDGGGAEEEEEAAAVGGATRVWSAELASAAASREGEDGGDGGAGVYKDWTSLDGLPHLKAATEAFRSVAPPPSWNLDGAGADGGTETKRLDAATTPKEFDPSVMTYDDAAAGGAKSDSSSGGGGSNKVPDLSSTASTAGTTDRETLDARAAEELEAFLSSASGGPAADEEAEEEEGYESDGGTPYVKDPRTGNWIHADLAPRPRPEPPAGSTTSSNGKKNGDKKGGMQPNGGDASMAAAMTAQGKKRKRKKAKFAAKNARCWIYVTGLPPDTDEEEVGKYFAKAGIIDLDPSTQRPKIKLYRRKNPSSDRDDDAASAEPGSVKGDASICYARPESVELALTLLDGAMYRPTSDNPLTVEPAKFEQHGSKFDPSVAADRRASNAKRKVARLAALQAVGWDEGDNGRITGGLKGLRIIVLKGMFRPDDFANDVGDRKLKKLEEEVHAECGECGDVEKITVFAKNPLGVVVVKFGQPTAASRAVEEYKGRTIRGRKVEASFWDGVTDYTVKDEADEAKEAKKRHDEFGSWLDSQDLPEELRLKVEGDGEGKRT